MVCWLVACGLTLVSSCGWVSVYCVGFDLITWLYLLLRVVLGLFWRLVVGLEVALRGLLLLAVGWLDACVLCCVLVSLNSVVGRCLFAWFLLRVVWDVCYCIFTTVVC